MKNLIAIITARGGSKRIPKKNIKDFMGKPMISYAIDAARESGIFDTIMVSTDSDEIADISRKYGAEVPFMRSERTASDTAVTYDVLEEVLTEYKNQGIEYKYTCCIYPCVPFLQGDSLKTAFAQLKDGVDGVNPVCAYSVPIEWAQQITEDGTLEPVDFAATLIRSQDLTSKYFDAGMFYFYRTDRLLANANKGPLKMAPYIIHESECQDIDTEEDWEMAELKYRMLKEG